MAVGDRIVRSQLGEDDPITYTPGVGDPVFVTGVFDDAYLRVDAGQPGIASSGPAVFLSLGDLPTDPETDTAATVTIAGVMYSPYEVQKDGLGAVLLHLHKTT